MTALEIVTALKCCYYSSDCPDECPLAPVFDCNILRLEAALQIEELLRENEQLKRDVAFLTSKIIKGEHDEES